MKATEYVERDGNRLGFYLIGSLEVRTGTEAAMSPSQRDLLSYSHGRQVAHPRAVGTVQATEYVERVTEFRP